MDNSTENVISDVNHELSSEWIVLSNRVRSRLQEVHAMASGTPVEAELALLAADTSKICDHIERIHSNVGQLLSELDEKPSEPEPATPTVEPTEVQLGAIQIQRETHELDQDFKGIIKALFMWKDDPAEKAKEKP